jgi:uncharacterized iron-regulated protein
MMRRTFALFSVLAVLEGCSASSTSAPSGPGGGDTGSANKTYATAEEAPRYEGEHFAAMQIFDAEKGAYLDEAGLLQALSTSRLIFFGEQHATAPVQELELWLLQRLTERHDDVTLAMEHFQRDEQPVIDKYLAGSLAAADFEKTSQPWPEYAKYWKPLVEHMKEKGRPVVALNVPKEAFDMIVSQYPAAPLDVFNGWDKSFKYDASLPPRPLAAWDQTFKDYFQANYDHAAHGGKRGMAYEESVSYFGAFAHIRDESMGYFAAQAYKAGDRVFTVAGDFHVQTGLATPDRAVKYAGGDASYALVTTTPVAELEALRAKKVSGRPVARFILSYEVP